MDEKNVQTFQAERVVEGEQENRESCEPGTQWEGEGLEEKLEQLCCGWVWL